MKGRSTATKTLIGLPIFLVVALGLGYGAGRLNQTLRLDPGLQVETNQTVTNTITTNSTNTEKYTQALTELAATVYQRMAQSSLLTNTTANQSSAFSAAKVILASVCWLSNNPDDLSYFESGAVATTFSTMVATYAAPTDTAPVCSEVSTTEQTQASRLFSLDDDGDGLNTIAEYWYDTNQFAKDTDQDGFQDNEEIANGFNPVGSGSVNQ